MLALPILGKAVSKSAEVNKCFFSIQENSSNLSGVHFFLFAFNKFSIFIKETKYQLSRRNIFIKYKKSKENLISVIKDIRH